MSSRHLPLAATPEEVLAREIAELRRGLADLRSVVAARPPGRLRVYTTAGRPSAVTAGAGASIYDSTLKKPLWSDGAAWRDAGGVLA